MSACNRSAKALALHFSFCDILLGIEAGLPFCSSASLSRRNRARLLSDSKSSRGRSAKAIYNSPIAVTYGHLASPEELYSEKGTALPLLIPSTSFSRGWGGSFVPVVRGGHIPPAVGRLGAVAGQQTLTWLPCTMGEPLRAAAWAQNAAQRLCTPWDAWWPWGLRGRGIRSSPELAETSRRSTRMASLIMWR